MLFSTDLLEAVVTELQQCCFQQACRKLLTQSCSNAVFNRFVTKIKFHWSMKQEVRNFLKKFSKFQGIVQRCSFKLGNELVNIFRNASFGMTASIW